MEDWLKEYKEELRQKEFGLKQQLRKGEFKTILDNCDAEIGKLKFDLEQASKMENGPSAMYKVRAKISIHAIEQKDKKPFFDAVSKKMFEVKNERLKQFNDVEKEQYKQAFNYEEHEREVEQIEREETKKRIQLKPVKGFEKNKIVGDFNLATPYNDREYIDLTIDHKGERWYYEKRGLEESFSIEDKPGNKIAIIRNHDPLKKFDSKANANLYIRDIKTNQMVRYNKNPINIETGLEIGKDEANLYFEKADRLDEKIRKDFKKQANPPKSKTEDRQHLYPGFNDAFNKRNTEKCGHNRQPFRAEDFPGPDINNTYQSDIGMDINHDGAPSASPGPDIDVGDMD